MRYCIKIITMMAACLLLLLSCTQEVEIVPPGSELVEVNIGTRAALYPTDPDSKIDRLRVMAFDNNGHIQSNKLYDFENDPTLSNPFRHKMKTGLYSFVFIANEPAANTPGLQAVAVRTTLNGITFATSAFHTTDVIPMIKEVAAVTVLPTNKVSIGGTEYATWTVSMIRLAVRFDIVMKSEVAWGTDFTGVIFDNIPDYVPLFGNYTEAIHSSVSPRSYPASGTNIRALDATEIAAEVAKDPLFTTKYAWSKKVERIILPSCVFTPKNDDARLLEFTVSLGAHTPSCTFGFDKAGGDNTLPRNYNYFGDVTILNPEHDLALELKAVDWDEVTVPGDPYRELNVSHIETTVGKLSTTRVYFWSNQKEVTVDETGYEDSGMTPFTVNDFFGDLGGAGAANVTYNSTTGQGHIDLKLEYDTPGIYVRRIRLNADGLKREITVNAAIPYIGPLADTPWVGTFHRKSEKGERIIYAGHSGAWTASVDDPTGQGAFVVLSTEFSQDLNLSTDHPGDAEDYPVADNLKSVSGYNFIYFRVGLTSTLQPSDPNRYATITLNHSGGAQSKIYVRQGEDDDYLMRKEDNNGAGSITTEWGGNAAQPRPLAHVFSPYNLTAPEFLNGTNNGGANVTDHPQLAVNGGDFTRYPTQAGAFFIWANPNPFTLRRAFHPISSVSALGSWSNAPTAVTWDTIKGDHETCPPGYRRMKDGPIDTKVPAGGSNIPDSEVRQSLYLDPLDSNTSMFSGNYLQGYYADGFFDRREIVDGSGIDAKVKSTVANGTADVAYAGLLFYNPNTSASLFLPASGNRQGGDGEAKGAGGYCFYWTSTSSAGTASWYLLSHLTGQYTGLLLQEFYTNGYAYNIRCVKE